MNHQNDNEIIKVLTEDFQRLADRSPDAIYRFDIASWTFPFFNKLFLELYGWMENGVKTLTPKSILDHIHPDDRVRFRALRAASLTRKNGDGEMEYRYVNEDGTIRWMHDKWTVIRDARGEPVAIEGFIRDNTRQKQAEMERDRSRHNALIGSYIVQNAAFQYVNPEFCRITGYSEKELIGIHPLAYVHQHDRHHVRHNAIQMLKSERSTPYEFCILDKKGGRKWILETVTPIQFEGSRAILGYFMDITDSKRAEKEKREKEKVQAILELAGAVCHELNNPLQVAVFCSDYLAGGSWHEQTMARNIQLLQNSMQRLVEITEKFQGITQYATKDYVDGKKIIDVDAASQIGVHPVENDNTELMCSC